MLKLYFALLQKNEENLGQTSSLFTLMLCFTFNSFWVHKVADLQCHMAVLYFSCLCKFVCLFELNNFVLYLTHLFQDKEANWHWGIGAVSAISDCTGHAPRCQGVFPLYASTSQVRWWVISRQFTICFVCFFPLLKQYTNTTLPL